MIITVIKSRDASVLRSSFAREICHIPFAIVMAFMYDSCQKINNAWALLVYG